MAKKYYAVKNGYKIGIFDSWDECKEQVSGFSGAEYKSFANREDAVNYIRGEAPKTTENIPAGTIVAYVDGSFNNVTLEYGYGCIIFHNGRRKELSKKFDKDAIQAAAMHNVAGEIEGAKAAMEYAVKNYDVETLELYFDYEGIEKWCTGEWKAKNHVTQNYKKFYDEIAKTVTVNFHKVKGHSGDALNDDADKLAKKAVGLI